MLVHFKKDSESNFTLHCARADRTSTWRKFRGYRFQLEHDLFHLFVETALGYHRAFYGILANGRDIEWFEQPARPDIRSKRPVLPVEAHLAEVIVGLLQTLRDDEEFFRHLPTVCQYYQLPVAKITPGQVRRIRDQARTRLAQWEGSKEGISLEFRENGGRDEIPRDRTKSRERRANDPGV